MWGSSPISVIDSSKPSARRDAAVWKPPCPPPIMTTPTYQLLSRLLLRWRRVDHQAVERRRDV